MSYIISNNNMTKGEDGVRNLKRCLEIIYTKLNLFRLVKPDTKLFENRKTSALFHLEIFRIRSTMANAGWLSFSHRSKI